MHLDLSEYKLLLKKRYIYYVTILIIISLFIVGYICYCHYRLTKLENIQYSNTIALHKILDTKQFLELTKRGYHQTYQILNRIKEQKFENVLFSEELLNSFFNLAKKEYNLSYDSKLIKIKPDQIENFYDNFNLKTMTFTYRTYVKDDESIYKLIDSMHKTFLRNIRILRVEIKNLANNKPYIQSDIEFEIFKIKKN